MSGFEEERQLQYAEFLRRQAENTLGVIREMLGNIMWPSLEPTDKYLPAYQKSMAGSMMTGGLGPCKM